MENRPAMHQAAERIVRRLTSGRSLAAFTGQLSEWLSVDLDNNSSQAEEITNSRATALLRAMNVIDDPTLGDFKVLMQLEPAIRLAMYDLLVDSGLANHEEVASLAPLPSPEQQKEISWLPLIIRAFAWRSGYPVNQLDPATPPDVYSPAGQVLMRSGQYIRQQLLRSPTERDRLSRQLSLPVTEIPTLDELSTSDDQIAPLPPHYRTPIAERYPEMSRETIQIESDDVEEVNELTIGEPLVITEDELAESETTTNDPVRMPLITITRDQVASETNTPPSPMPSSAVMLPNQSRQSPSKPSFTVALRQMFGQEQLASTKLKVLVQRYPDGPGLFGLQVRVTSKGIKSYVAGTTDRDGKFVCELPVRIQSGLTYDVDITWPREQGGEVERKSITLNTERTHFTLPFYQQLSNENIDS
jgi:hypothetical protein